MLSCYIELLNQPGVWEGFTQSNSKCNTFRNITKGMGMMCKYQCILKILKDHTQYFPEIKKKYIWQPFLINLRGGFENHSKNDNFARKKIILWMSSMYHICLYFKRWNIRC